MPLPANMFPNKLPPTKVPNSIPKDPAFCSFVLLLIVLVMPFSKIPESAPTWSIYNYVVHFSFEIINVVVPELCIFF